jgi:hypothetical protein
MPFVGIFGCLAEAKRRPPIPSTPLFFKPGEPQLCLVADHSSGDSAHALWTPLVGKQNANKMPGIM